MKFQFKHWKSVHSYVGLSLSLFFLTLGATGFLMVDETMFGVKEKPVTFAPLVAWYGSMKEEIKDHKEREVTTLYTKQGQPVRIASDHGAILIEEETSRWVKAEDSALALTTTTETFAKTEIPHMNQQGEKPLHWGKIIDDLHTGKFFGGWLILFYYLTAFSMVGLTFTGIYLWYKPWAQKRKRKTATVAKPAIAKMDKPIVPELQPESE